MTGENPRHKWHILKKGYVLISLKGRSSEVAGMHIYVQYTHLDTNVIAVAAGKESLHYASTDLTGIKLVQFFFHFQVRLSMKLLTSSRLADLFLSL